MHVSSGENCIMYFVQSAVFLHNTSLPASSMLQFITVIALRSPFLTYPCGLPSLNKNSLDPWIRICNKWKSKTMVINAVNC